MPSPRRVVRPRPHSDHGGDGAERRTGHERKSVPRRLRRHRRIRGHGPADDQPPLGDQGLWHHREVGELAERLATDGDDRHRRCQRLPPLQDHRRLLRRGWDRGRGRRVQRRHVRQAHRVPARNDPVGRRGRPDRRRSRVSRYASLPRAKPSYLPYVDEPLPVAASSGPPPAPPIADPIADPIAEPLSPHEHAPFAPPEPTVDQPSTPSPPTPPRGPTPPAPPPGAGSP